MSFQRTGVLHLKVLSVSGAGQLNAQGTYCDVYIGGKKERTSVLREKNAKPEWNQTLTFPVNEEANLVLYLMKEAAIFHQTVGEAVVNLDAVYSFNRKEGTHPLLSKGGNQIGFISLQFEFIPSLAPKPAIPISRLQPYPEISDKTASFSAGHNIPTQETPPAPRISSYPTLDDTVKGCTSDDDNHSVAAGESKPKLGKIEPNPLSYVSTSNLKSSYITRLSK